MDRLEDLKGMERYVESLEGFNSVFVTKSEPEEAREIQNLRRVVVE